MDESVQFRLKARSTAAVDDPLNFLAPSTITLILLARFGVKVHIVTTILQLIEPTTILESMKYK
jgi:hypothetical protein